MNSIQSIQQVEESFFKKGIEPHRQVECATQTREVDSHKGRRIVYHRHERDRYLIDRRGKSLTKPSRTAASGKCTYV